MPISNMREVVIFDLDGTLADITHRLTFIQRSPKDWEQFFSHIPYDSPIDHMVKVFMLYKEYSEDTIVFATGRPERTRADTVAWLEKYDLYDGEQIYMRPDGDRRCDALIKSEILQQLYDDSLAPTMVFDDRDRVVQMWRAHNIPCMQVAEGNF